MTIDQDLRDYMDFRLDKITDLIIQMQASVRVIEIGGAKIETRLDHIDKCIDGVKEQLALAAPARLGIMARLASVEGQAKIVYQPARGGCGDRHSRVCQAVALGG